MGFVVSAVPLLRRVASLRDWLQRAMGRAEPVERDAEVAGWLVDAEIARGAGRHDEALALYQRIARRHRTHLPTLRAVRDLARAAGRPRDAIEAQERLVTTVDPAERPAEIETLAGLHYELGRADLDAGHPASAIAHFKNATRVDRRFVPALLGLGEAQRAAGDPREAVRTWERAAEAGADLPVLARLERAYREEGRPARMIALYQEALARAPDDLGLAVALGRVYLQLEMLDEAADQLERVEARAPGLPLVHAYLGEVFQRRGDAAAAFEEYRRALALAHAFEWPHRCRACNATASAWQEQCAHCRRFNTVAPVIDPSA